MPVILIIGPYRFFFYSNEGNPLKAPHIHVSQDGEGLSLVEPFGVLLNASFPRRSCAKYASSFREKRDILKGVS